MQCLSVMKDNTELDDWANNIYMGMMYFALGHKDKAEECVMCNIDFGYESEISSNVLAKFESETPAEKFAVPERLPEQPAQKTEKFSVWGSFMKWLKPEQTPKHTLPPVKKSPPQPVQEVTQKVDARYYRLLNVKTLRGKAEKGDSEAQYHLGRKCEKSGTSSELNEALMWYRKAAEKGHIHAREAYIALSLRQAKYYLEHGSNDDAIRCYEGAANMGSTHARDKLAEIRKPESPPTPSPEPQPKREKPKREKIDMHLLKEQARHGITDSQYKLATVYEGRTKYLCSVSLRVITLVAVIVFAVVGILHMSLLKFAVYLAAMIGGELGCAAGSGHDSR